MAREIATLKELEEYYSIEDAYRMHEIIIVNNHNERIANSGDSS